MNIYPMRVSQPAMQPVAVRSHAQFGSTGTTSLRLTEDALPHLVSILNILRIGVARSIYCCL